MTEDVAIARSIPLGDTTNPADGSIRDVAAAIDGAKPGAFQKRIFLLCFLTLMIDGFDMQVLPFTASAVARDLVFAPSRFGILISASLLGMVLGGLVCGALADRYGRRWIILVGVALFGVFTLAKTFAGSFAVLLILQLITGLGLGGVFANAMSLAAEYVPLRNRRLILTVISAAYPIGGMVASYVTAMLMATIGWRGVFAFGGVIALLLLIALLRWLPESVRQLALRGAPQKYIRAIMTRIVPEAGTRIWTTSEQTAATAPVRDLFDRERATTTAILCVAMMLCLMSAYFVISWSPLLFGMAGLTPDRAAIAAGMLQGGSVFGSLLWGRLTDRLWPPAVLGAASVLSALCFGMLGHVTGVVPLLVGVALLTGIGMGVQNAYNAFTAALYPTAMRSTAFGLIISVGRLGSIAGPLLGGVLLAAKWPIAHIYYVPAAMAGCATLCMVLLTALPSSRRLVTRSRESEPAAVAGHP